MSTREAMHERACTDPHGPVTSANEADPGTFGSESLVRTSRDRMGDTSTVASPIIYANTSLESSRTRAADFNHLAARQAFVDGVEVEMPTDANVRTYAG